MGFSLLQSVFLLASARQALASCAHGTFLSPRAEDGSVKVNTFGYAGEIGPLNWHALAAENTACNTGTQQSPISMVTGTFNMIPASDLQLDIPDFNEGTEFENLGTTVEVIAKGGTLAFGTKTFDLQQFHFHLPSEHLDNGTSQAMEMHMVFQSAAQEIAVIGMYIEIATDNTGIPAVVQAPATNVTRRGRPTERRKNQNSRRQVVRSTGPTVLLETVLSQVGSISTPGTKVATGPVIMSEIVRILQSGSFQGYMGSLTTPPCSEGVNWLVSTARLAVTPQTFTAVRDVIGFNSRFPQNTPGRANLLSLSSAVSAPAAPAGVVAEVPGGLIA